MEKIALKSGRLLKGGEPCRRSAAIAILLDFQRGRLPHYVAPPELKDEKASEKRKKATLDGIKVKQDLSEIEKISNKMDEEEKQVSAEEESGSDNSDSDEENDETEGPVINADSNWEEEN